MKKLFAIVIFTAVIGGLISCGDVAETGNENVIKSFDQVGYLKTESKLRYFTFVINTDTLIENDSILDKVFAEIKTHGSQQMSSAGAITASFYYTDKSMAPDITLMTPDAANELAHKRKPIASVWIMPTGQVNLIKRPE